MPHQRTDTGAPPQLTIRMAAAVLGIYPGNSISEKVNYLLRNGLTDFILDAMTRAELRLLLEKLDYHIVAEQPISDPRSVILATLGLGIDRLEESSLSTDAPAEAAQILRRKIQSNEFDVFMVHHSVNRAAVLGICRLLRRQGIYPWIDVEQVRPGTWFQDAMQSAILQARAAAIVFGPEGVGKWQIVEIRTFIEQCVTRGKPVIPVLLPGMPEIPAELPFMRELHHVTFENTVFEETPLRQLVWGITGIYPKGRS